MDESELRTSIDQIMLRGAAMCGCPLPQTEFFAEFISSELTYFMVEMGYAVLTLKEVLLALRLNATGLEKYPSGELVERVEFSGNCFNVTFIAKVLAGYIQLRFCLDRKLQNHIDGY